MIVHNIDPVALQLGPLKIHWYGLMYIIGFGLFWFLGNKRARRPGSGWTEQEVGDLLFYAAVGLLVGARLGYMLFYSEGGMHLWEVWKGGMSFHGGLVGVLAAGWYFARKTGKSFAVVTDFIVPLAPLGLFCGRMGNFINGELWGKVTDLPWGMVFPGGGPQPRHPSMLYEALLEGLVLFAIMWFYTSKPRPLKTASGLFLACYGLMRISVEFIRVPDAQLGYRMFGWVTQGMLLSLPMVLIGIAVMWWGFNKVSYAPTGPSTPAPAGDSKVKQKKAKRK